MAVAEAENEWLSQSVRLPPWLRLEHLGCPASPDAAAFDRCTTEPSFRRRLVGAMGSAPEPVWSPGQLFGLLNNQYTVSPSRS